MYTQLTGKQLLRNSIEMCLIYRNTLSRLNELTARKLAAEQRISEIISIFNKKGGKKNCTVEVAEYNSLRSEVQSYGAIAAIHTEGRQTQNCGLRQFRAYGRNRHVSNTIYNWCDVDAIVKALPHCMDFKTDMRLRDSRFLQINSIKIMFVHTVGSDGRPLSWSWLNWDGENHTAIFEHNEGITFDYTVRIFKKGMESVAAAGTYNVAGIEFFVRPEDLDFIPKKGMNYNLRKILSAINNGYVGVNNWQE